MNALDVLVTPRAAGGVPGGAEAAPPAGEAEATAGAFIALLGAMLGAAPVVELKPVMPTLLADGGEGVLEGETAEPEADNANGELVTTQGSGSGNGTALVSDSELVGIARAALAIMKRNASASKAANAAGRAARPVLTVPLAQLARNAARKSERVEGEAMKVKGAEKRPAEVEAPEIEAVAPATSGPSAVLPAPEAVIATAAPAAIVAEAISAASAAVRMPTVSSPDLDSTDGASTTQAGEPVVLPRSSAPAAPLVWTPAPVMAAASGGATDSALVNAVTQLIDALTSTEGVTSLARAEGTPEKSGVLELPSAVTLESLEVTASLAPVVREPLATQVQVVEAVSNHDVVAPVVAPDGRRVDAPVASVVDAAPAMIDAGKSDEHVSSKDATQPRNTTAVPAPAASGSHSRAQADSHGEQPRQEHEQPARKVTSAESTPQWSTAHAAPSVTPVSEEKGAPLPEVAMARTPDEPTRAPQATSHVTLQLDRDTLGASRIRVAVRGDTVRATILADDSKAAALSAQLPELRRALEERGFTEARVVIQVEGNHEHQGTVIAGAVTDDLRARPAASARSESGREEQQPRGGRRQDPDGDRPRDRRRQAPREETA